MSVSPSLAEVIALRDKSLKFKKARPADPERLERLRGMVGGDECKLEFILWAEGTSLDISGIHRGEPVFRPAICAWEAWKAAHTRTSAASLRDEGWLPIDSAPKDGTPVTVWGRYWSDDQGWMPHAMTGQFTERFPPHSPCWIAWGPSCSFAIRPTHWKPPTPPSQPAAQERQA